MNVNDYNCCSFFPYVRVLSFGVLYFSSIIRRKIDLEQKMAGISMADQLFDMLLVPCVTINKALRTRCNPIYLIIIR